LFVFVILGCIGITYTGAVYSDYLPMVTSQTYDNTQLSYNVSRILNTDHTFNSEKYAAYSPLFLPPAFALNIGLSFAALTAVLVHTGLFHGKEIWYQLRSARNQEPDVHMERMKKYPEAPDWWYAVLFVSTVGLGLATCLAYDSQLPWWAFFVSIILALVFVIPTCSILATSNIALSLNVISPFLAGFIIPGRPIGVMMFKGKHIAPHISAPVRIANLYIPTVYSTIVLGQAQTYSSDLKMAHYVSRFSSFHYDPIQSSADTCGLFCFCSSHGLLSAKDLPF
jgi:OPT family oligopeptide transporter